MSENWTKGPWLAAAKPSSIVGLPVVAPRDMGRSVCNVTVGHDQSKANAHLIAAAPDLYGQTESTIVDLELLRDAVDDGDPRPELLIRIDDIVRRSRSALRRARGEQP